jgi:hypothetical protein
MKRSILWFLPALGLLLVAGGCSRSDLVHASGRLTYKGKPVPNVWVKFHPDDKGKRPSQGITDEDGKFQLSNSRAETGVFLGKHSVSLKYRAAADEEPQRASASQEMKNAVASYGDPATSGLHYEITRSGQQVNIELQ